MTEERTEYTTQPDELTQLRRQNRELSEKLDRQVAAWNGGTDALTAHAAQQAQRIAELEATVARLEADSKRLRHLDSMPVDALDYALQWCNHTGCDDAVVNEIAAFIAGNPGEKQVRLSTIPVNALRRQYSQQEMSVYDFGLDAREVYEWLATLDGAA